jgi:hypothetical protein
VEERVEVEVAVAPTLLVAAAGPLPELLPRPEHVALSLPSVEMRLRTLVLVVLPRAEPQQEAEEPKVLPAHLPLRPRLQRSNSNWRNRFWIRRLWCPCKTGMSF